VQKRFDTRDDLFMLDESACCYVLVASFHSEKKLFLVVEQAVEGLLDNRVWRDGILCGEVLKPLFLRGSELDCHEQTLGRLGGRVNAAIGMLQRPLVKSLSQTEVRWNNDVPFVIVFCIDGLVPMLWQPPRAGATPLNTTLLLNAFSADQATGEVPSPKAFLKPARGGARRRQNCFVTSATKSFCIILSFYKRIWLSLLQ
jgi:hypothetical protein